MRVISGIQTSYFLLDCIETLPKRPLSCFSMQIDKVSAACSCCHSHWMVDWTILYCTGLVR